MKLLNPEKGSSIGEPFQGFKGCLLQSQGSRCARTAGLKLANAFGVKSKLNQYLTRVFLAFPTSPALDFEVLRLALAKLFDGPAIRYD